MASIKIEAELPKKRWQLRYSIKQGRIAFDCEMCAVHAKLREGLLKFL